MVYPATVNAKIELNLAGQGVLISQDHTVASSVACFGEISVITGTRNEALVQAAFFFLSWVHPIRRSREGLQQIESR